MSSLSFFIPPSTKIGRENPLYNATDPTSEQDQAYFLPTKEGNGRGEVETNKTKTNKTTKQKPHVLCSA